jgi:NAD(P)-dependent dehydrogenase (short-subunit alcohol dehydrogenase family)
MGLDGKVLDDKVIAVVGVGPGLGTEVARLCLRDGADVALGARTVDRCEAVAAELDPDGKRTLAAAVDVTDQATVDRFIAATVDRFGRLDGVAVVAAHVTTIGDAVTIDDDVWRTSFDTNVLGPLHVARAAQGALAAAGGGSIVLVGTQAAYDPKPGMAAYGVTKVGAQVGLVHYLARELGARRIRVNCVETNWMLGPLVQGYMDMMAGAQGVTADAVIADIAKDWPIPEMPLDEDVAEAIAYLLSSRARIITGQTLRVNAGEYLA